MAVYQGVRDIARLIADNTPRQNPIVTAVVRQILAPVGGTAMVMVERGGYVRRAIYPLPVDPVVNRIVFITRLGPPLQAPLFVIASGFQLVPSPSYDQSPIWLTETDPGEDGIYGTWDDVHYLLRDDDGYYLTDQ